MEIVGEADRERCQNQVQKHNQGEETVPNLRGLRVRVELVPAELEVRDFPLVVSRVVTVDLTRLVLTFKLYLRQHFIQLALFVIFAHQYQSRTHSVEHADLEPEPFDSHLTLLRIKHGPVLCLELAAR